MTINIITETPTNYNKEELRKKVQYISESDIIPELEEPEKLKAYGWFNHPMSPKHRKRIIKKTIKNNRKLDIERIGKNYVV